MGKLLAKGVIEPFTGDADIYSDVYISKLLVYNIYSILSHLITTCICLLGDANYQTCTATYSARWLCFFY